MQIAESLTRCATVFRRRTGQDAVARSMTLVCLGRYVQFRTTVTTAKVAGCSQLARFLVS